MSDGAFTDADKAWQRNHASRDTHIKASIPPRREQPHPYPTAQSTQCSQGPPLAAKTQKNAKLLMVNPACNTKPDKAKALLHSSTEMNQPRTTLLVSSQ
jgi:hypothetical protein